MQAVLGVLIFIMKRKHKSPQVMKSVLVCKEADEALQGIADRNGSSWADVVRTFLYETLRSKGLMK